MGKFVITKRRDGEIQFNLRAANGQVILVSEGYSKKLNCENGIQSVKVNAQDESKFIRKTSFNGKYYFNLMASNGQVIGTSEMYESAAARDNGITAVTEYAPHAVIEDQAN